MVNSEDIMLNLQPAYYYLRDVVVNLLSDKIIDINRRSYINALNAILDKKFIPDSHMDIDEKLKNNLFLLYGFASIRDEAIANMTVKMMRNKVHELIKIEIEPVPFPDEINCRIISFLDKNSVYRLSGVSKFWYRISRGEQKIKLIKSMNLQFGISGELLNHFETNELEEINKNLMKLSSLSIFLKEISPLLNTAFYNRDPWLLNLLKNSSARISQCPNGVSFNELLKIAAVCDCNNFLTAHIDLICPNIVKCIFDLAVLGRSLQTIKRLLIYNPSIGIDQFSLCMAAKSGDLVTFDFILSMNVDLKILQQTFHAAIQSGNLYMVKHMINLNSNLSVNTESMNYACKTSNKQINEFIFSKGFGLSAY